MKNKIKLFNTIGVAAALLFGLTGCFLNIDTVGLSDKSNKAELLSLLFFSEDIVEYRIGNPIPESVYTAGDDLGQYASQYRGYVIVQNVAAFAQPIMLVVSKNASVSMARSAGSAPGNDKFTFKSRDTVPGLTNSDSIVVEVIAEDRKTKNYYIILMRRTGSVSALSGISVGALQADCGIPDTGSPTEVNWANVEPGTILLEGVTIRGKLSAAGVVGTKIEYGIARQGEAEPALSETVPAWVFANGDIIYIRATSINGESVSLYKIEVERGSIASLASVSINGQSVWYLGTPQPSLDNEDLITGFFGSNMVQDTIRGFTVSVTPLDTDATVMWAASPSNPRDTDYSTAESIVFKEGDFLFIKVVSVNGNVTLCYKIQIYFLGFGLITYGSPEIREASEQYIDPMWDKPDLNLFNISRVFLGEIIPFRFYNTVDGTPGHTSAWAKAYWDDDGLYVYCNVDFHDYYASLADKSTGKITSRIAAISSVFLFSDSLVIYVNERYQRYSRRGFSRLYCINADGATLTIGETSDDVFVTAPAFPNGGKCSAWLRIKDGRQLGYTIIAQVPWAFKNNLNADAVFGPDGLVKTIGKDDGPMINVDFELIASTSAGSRDARLTWSFLHNNYGEIDNYGIVKLIMGDGERGR